MADLAKGGMLGVKDRNADVLLEYVNQKRI